jgi:SAM-dependent methyltransferase
MADHSLPSPYDSPELYDLLFEPFDFDASYWLKAAREAGGPVLEVGCGTGRILLRLLEAGLDVDGLDASAPMLERLRSKAAAKGLEARAVAGDMRAFSLPRRYAFVFCAFNGFAHCETTEDQISALRCWREHLIPGGAVALHMTYPGPRYWSEQDGEPAFEIEAHDPVRGRTYQLWDARTKNPVAQLQVSRMEIRELDANGKILASHEYETRQRWVYKPELELLFRAAGFARWDVVRGFDDGPLTIPEDQMIARAWR